MNAFFKKEIHQLLPGFLAGMMMALAVWLIPWEWGNSFPGAALFLLWLCPALMITLGVFGREYSSGTFSMLLAHPVARNRIWWAKTLPAAAMVAAVWLVGNISLTLHDPYNDSFADLRAYHTCTALFALAFYSGGLWSTLLFRQVTVAFWFTLLVPVALWIAVEDVLLRQRPFFVHQTLLIVFVAYAIAGFLFAMRLFLKAQDVQWTGGDVQMPELRGLTRFKTRRAPLKKWCPRMALLMKEFQLHQAHFMMAGALALVHLGVLATLKFASFEKNSLVEYLLGLFWCIWLFMPLLIGCSAAAEERRIGTLEGQLCLPVKRSTQFALKLFVVIVLSVALGGMPPLLLEGPHVLLRLEPGSLFWSAYLSGGFLPVLLLSVVTAFIGFMAFHASTLTRNPLQAFAPAVLGIYVACMLLYAASTPKYYFRHILWRGPLIYIFAVPVLGGTLLVLAYRNYQHVLPGWKRWRDNLLTLVVSMVAAVVCTIAVYQRTWELLVPIEPAHDVVRLTQKPVRLDTYNYGHIKVVLPDGRIWVGTSIVSGLGGRFLDGSDWRDAVVRYCDMAAIKRDGSLWVSGNPSQFVEFTRPKISVARFTKLVRMGDGNDWKSILSSDRYFGSLILLKNDGTIWSWGGGRAALRDSQPEQLGKDSDWTEIFTLFGRIYFRKTNGQVWAWPKFERGSRVEMISQNKNLVERTPELENLRWKNSFDCFTDDRERFQAGIGDDGTFRMMGIHTGHYSMGNDLQWASGRGMQIGTETNWLKGISTINWIHLLKADGTLWEWDFKSVPASNARWVWNSKNAPDADPKAYSFKRFSEHSDWVDISGEGVEEWADNSEPEFGFTSLAADGSLWYWRPEWCYDVYYYDQMWLQHPLQSPLLRPSRKPLYLGNIFNDETR